MEPRINDPDFLREQQYRNASNLNARIVIHQRFSTNQYGWIPFVHDALANLSAEAAILELGCGPASLWAPALERVAPGWRITLTDFSPGMLAEAQGTLAQVATPEVVAQFTFRQADAEVIPFADATFDAVIANHMLYHVPDRRKAIGEVRRVLKPGGHFVAATNGEDHLKELWRLGAEFAQQQGIETVDWRGTVGRTFSLENGFAQLAEFFSAVEILLYEDALLVTEVEPLVRYYYSMGVLPAALEDDLRAFLQQEMDARGGVIEIGKSTGIFVAV